ncbi:MAG: DUF4116 domain-containing protein [Chlamydiia bacterium]|nr:DUF4116 domain-containing protein [Chlamydiia bacterium]
MATAVELNGRRHGGLAPVPEKPIIDDLQQALASVRQDGQNYRNVSARLQICREVALATVQTSAFMLPYLQPQFWNDREIVLIAVSGYPTVLHCASTALKNDTEIFLGVVQKNPDVAMDHATPQMRNNKEMMLRVMHLPDFDFFAVLSERLQNDKDMAIIGVGRNPRNFQIVSSRLQDDNDVVLTAARRAGEWERQGDIGLIQLVLGSASARLRQDPEVLAAAYHTSSTDEPCHIL